MDPGFDIAPEDVRHRRTALSDMADGVVINPTKDVAYVWSENSKIVWVLNMQLPGV